MKGYAQITLSLLLAIVLFLALPLWAWPPSDSDKEKWKTLLKQGKAEELKELFQDLQSAGEDLGQWVNMALGEDEGTPLILATIHNQAAVVELLLNHGAIASPENESEGALHAAAKRGYGSIITMLINADANPNQGYRGGSALKGAASNHQLDAARKLIRAGAMVNAHNVLGLGPLHSAAMTGDLEMTRLLLDSGANIEGEDSESEPLGARDLAMRGFALQLLKADASSQGKHPAEGTPLNMAADGGFIPVVSELMRRRADVAKVLPGNLASIQQVYSPNSGVSVNFRQYFSPSSWAAFAPRLQNRINKLKGHFKPSGRPLINQAVLRITLDIPDDVKLYDPANQQITRIESFLLSKDFIAEPNLDARLDANILYVLFTGTTPDQRTPYLDVGPVGNEEDWFAYMDQAIPLGVRVDHVFFYENAHRELVFNEYESALTSEDRKKRPTVQWSQPRAETFMEWDGKELRERRFDETIAELIASSAPKLPRKKVVRVTKSQPLKRYWGTREIPSDPVYIENTADPIWVFQGIGQPYLPFHIPPDDVVIEQFLEWHRPALARLMTAALNDSPDLFSRAKQRGVHLFCLGCGSGEDVRVFHKALKQQGFQSQSFGIEILDLLHWNAIVDSGSLRNEVGFIRADAHEAAALIRKNRKGSGLTVVVAEDFLVHQVLPGPYDALKILHQLIQPGVADMVIISGVHHPLVNERIASAAGWSVEQVNIYHSKAITKYDYPPNVGGQARRSVPAYVLTHPNDRAAEWQKIEQRSLLRSQKVSSTENGLQIEQGLQTLDLSLSGLPIQALKHFIKKVFSLNITLVDLSYSFLEEHQLDTTINLLSGFPALTHVIVSGHEPWYMAFEQKLAGTGQLRLLRRKDNKYRHELPSLEPDTARLLGLYKDMPVQRVEFMSGQPRVFRDRPAWTEDIDSGYLSAHLLPRYHQGLMRQLSSHHIQLLPTPMDGLCFFHAAAIQLHIHESELRASLHNHLIINAETIQATFPQFSGTQFHQLLAELLQGSWGDAGQALLIAWIFSRRVILMYFHSQSGQVKVLILNPDGSAIEADSLPNIILDQDILLIHNGQGHWLAGGGQMTGVNLQQHNAAQLGETEPTPPPAVWSDQVADQLYTPDIFPKLIGLLLSIWAAKQGSSLLP
ncbi:MAG: ankyrin repeat domain-containing protein [Endozoicomonas sp.]